MSAYVICSCVCVCYKNVSASALPPINRCKNWLRLGFDDYKLLKAHTRITHNLTHRHVCKYMKKVQQFIYTQLLVYFCCSFPV